MQEWVSVYETCEYDIGAPDIHRFLRVDRLSTKPRDKGVTINITMIRFKTINKIIFNQNQNSNQINHITTLNKFLQLKRHTLFIEI